MRFARSLGPHTGRQARAAPGAVALSLPFALAAVLSATARAQAPEVEVRAVSEYAAVRAGGAFRVAVRLAVPAGWHIGWINPGAGGLPTTIAWHLPAGVTGGTTDWPFPETDDAGGDVSHVYRGTVTLFSSFRADSGASGILRLAADLSWGLCQAVCIPQRRSVSVAIPVTRGATLRTPEWTEAEAATRLLPMLERGAAVTATREDQGLRLAFTGLKAGPVTGSWVTFFPAEPRRPSVVAPVRRIANGVEITLPLAVLGDTSVRVLGVLVGAHRPGAPPPFRAIAVDAAVAR